MSCGRRLIGLINNLCNSRRARSPQPAELVAQQISRPFSADQIPYGVMSLTVILIKILEFMFVAGWIGSAIVLVLTGIENVGTLLDRKDETSH